MTHHMPLRDAARHISEREFDLALNGACRGLYVCYNGCAGKRISEVGVLF